MIRVKGSATSRRQGRLLMLPHPLTNFEIQKYYQKEFRFNGANSRNSSPKIKDGVCVIVLDEYKSIGTHLIGLNGNGEQKLHDKCL